VSNSRAWLPHSSPVAERTLAQWICLALVAEEPAHGWAVVRTLASDGDIGRIWSLSRPLVYRALDELQADGAIVEAGTETGGGPARRILKATPASRSAVRRWLKQPVEHMRDVRTELLCKVRLCERAGIDPTPLVKAQLDAFGPMFDALARRARKRDADAVDRWRAASSVSVRRFLETELRRH